MDVEPGVGKMVSYLNREKKMDAIVGTRPVAPPAPKGLYLYGNVGSGMHALHLLGLCREIFYTIWCHIRITALCLEYITFLNLTYSYE